MDKHPITLEQQRKVWTIHRSVKGLTYYYNRATKKSQYEMPECFKTTEQTLEHPQWKQYKNADGKKFYYNAETRKSVWHLPNEVKQWRAKMQQAKRLERLNNKDNENDDLLNVTDQQKKKFVALLRDKSVNLNTKWDACVKLCEEEDRWKALKTSEKKRIFQDYIDELKKQEDNQKRAKLQVHKTNFLKMLMQHKTLNSDCKMHKMISDFAPDPRWRALEEIDRENVYQMYMDQLLNKEKEQAKIKKKQNMDGLRRLMEQENVSHRIKWQEFKQQYAQNEHFKGLHNYDRLSKFTEYILEQEKKYEDQQHRDKQIRERKNRDNFRQLLLKKMKAGQINHKSRWSKFVKENKDQSALVEMMDPNQYGSSAHELFEDIMEGIRQYHKQFKTKIKQHFKTIGFRMLAETTQQTFEEKLKGFDTYWTLKPIMRHYFYNYFHNKICSKNKQGAKKGKKDKKVVYKVLKHFKDIRPKSQLSEWLARIHEELKSYHLEYPIAQEAISKYFSQYISELDSDKRKKKDKSESKSDSDSSDNGKDKRRKKRRRKSTESSDSDKPVKKPKKQEVKQRTVEKPKLLEKLPEKPDIKVEKPKQPNDNEQQGEIKDEDLQGKHEKHRSDQKKLHKKKKSRKRSDSSDS